MKHAAFPPSRRRLLVFTSFPSQGPPFFPAGSSHDVSSWNRKEKGGVSKWLLGKRESDVGKILIARKGGPTVRTKRSGKRGVIIPGLVVMMIFAAWFIGSVSFAAETVSFPGTTKTAKGELVTLTGQLTKPEGNGPFPAVVLLHGCSGINMFPDAWSERLANWGYVAFMVDSFGPRGFKEICTNLFRVHHPLRVQDAYDALSYLSALPFVDRNRIGLMGWSHGGLSALAAVSRSNYATSAAIVTTKTVEPSGPGGFNHPGEAFSRNVSEIEGKVLPSNSSSSAESRTEKRARREPSPGH